MGCKVIKVVAGVIRDGSRLLACQRPAGKALAGGWEFPGGKLETGESCAQALERELAEELALDVTVLDEMYQLQTVTADGKRLELHFLRALKNPGSEPFAREQQQFRWLEADELAAVAWLETDREFVDFLMLAEKKRR